MHINEKHWSLVPPRYAEHVDRSCRSKPLCICILAFLRSSFATERGLISFTHIIVHIITPFFTTVHLLCTTYHTTHELTLPTEDTLSHFTPFFSPYYTYSISPIPILSLFPLLYYPPPTPSSIFLPFPIPSFLPCPLIHPAPLPPSLPNLHSPFIDSLVASVKSNLIHVLQHHPISLLQTHLVCTHSMQ